MDMDLPKVNCLIKRLKISGASWTLEEIFKVYQWLYPEEYEQIQPKKYGDCSEHFRQFLGETRYRFRKPRIAVISKKKWMKLIKRQHGKHDPALGGNQKYL